MCSPYLTGSLGVMLVLVTFNYWSVSTQNSDLMLEVQRMTKQMKLSSGKVVQLEGELDAARGEAKRCSGTKDTLEAKAARLVEEKQEVEQAAREKGRELERLEEQAIACNREKEELDGAKARVAKELEGVKANVSSCSFQLSSCREKVALCQDTLANERAERLVKPLGIHNRPLKGEQEGSLGKGQLPDVDVNAVEVVKKDTLGHNGLILEPEGGAAETRSSKGPPVMALPQLQAKGISSTSSVKPPGLGGGVAAPPLQAPQGEVGLGVGPPPLDVPEGGPVPANLNPDRAEDDSQVGEEHLEEDQNPDGQIDETVDVEKQHYLVDKANEVVESGEIAVKDAGVELSGENNDNLDNLKKSLNESENADEEDEKGQT